MTERVAFACNGQDVTVDVDAGESLLSVLRERLGLVSVKDGCAPQGQCGCCTVLVDGAARVACVTPATRVDGKSVTTVEGLDDSRCERLAAAFLATGGSQCGFCTPGIVVRAAALLTAGRTSRPEIDRALAAHLCRCTGWQTVYEAIEKAAEPVGASQLPSRRLDAAERRAELEGGVAQRVAPDVPLGAGGFADDRAPHDALVAVPLARGSRTESPDGSVATDWIDVAGVSWVVRETLHDARAAAGKVQGRRTTLASAPPIALPPRLPGGVRLATSWVEPAYLEPDASWCAPGGDPASTLANGGAFGGKARSIAPEAARALADHFGRPVRVVFSREDTVRLGPKRAPIAASAVWREGAVEIGGRVARGGFVPYRSAAPCCYAFDVRARWTEVDVAGPPVGAQLRAAGIAEQTVLIEGALDAAGVERAALVRDERVAAVLLDSGGRAASGALAGAHVEIDGATGEIVSVRVSVAAGDPLDDVVLRSYAIGAVHMALGWVCTESIAVDPESGEVHDLTIRSFGIIRARDVPPIDVEIVDDPGAPLAGASDAVFAATAAAAWNALARAEGSRPEAFPARETRAARRLRR